MDNLLEQIKKSIEYEDYNFSIHALRRGLERKISLQEALYVLQNGVHEKAKTVFDTRYQAWKYAIRGKTPDGSEIRVVVAFERGMVIITVIKLMAKGRRRHL
jgi:hypothetical protein